MKYLKIILSAVTLSVLSQGAFASQFALDGRSLGMGGVSVATADLATAAWLNPAMLTNQRSSDKFSLLVGVGASLRDDDDMINDVDAFQDANLRRQAATGGSAEETQAILDMRVILSGIDGKIINPELTSAAAIGVAFDSFAMAISVRSDVFAGGVVTNLSCDPILPAPCDPNEIFSNQFNILNIEGVLVTELGVSFAKRVKIANQSISIGIKPKIVDLQVYSITESIVDASTGLSSLTDDAVQTSLGTFVSADLGVAIDLSNSFLLGINIRNLFTDKFSILNQTLELDTEARIGIAFKNRRLMMALDFDITENKAMLVNSSFNTLKTRYVAAGIEYNAFDFAQLRLGVRKNIADNISKGAEDNILTAGVGFWLGFNLDIAAAYTENSIGGFLQAGFRF